MQIKLEKSLLIFLALIVSIFNIAYSQSNLGNTSEFEEKVRQETQWRIDMLRANGEVVDIEKIRTIENDVRQKLQGLVPSPNFLPTPQKQTKMYSPTPYNPNPLNSSPQTNTNNLMQLYSDVLNGRRNLQSLTPTEQQAVLRVYTLLNGATSGCSSVIESQIDGESNGWDGETIYKLTNGQIWQQTEYHYEYSYSYSPEVLIYKSGGCCKMKIEDVDEAVCVKQLK